jgi:restriction system protein
MKNPVIWGIHMPREHGLTPIEQGFVAIGWDAMGDLSAIKPTRDAFKAAYGETYPDENPAAIPVSAGVAYRFAVEIKEGDLIIFPSKPDRMVNIGVVDGPYEYRPQAPLRKPNVRRVRWLKHLPRTSFSQAALYEIGSALTLFQVSSNADEFLAALEGHAPQPEAIDQSTAEQVTAQVQESTEDFIIKRLKSSQTTYQFEHFVAHLLKCMGYYARVTQASGDGGVDIIAHRDELGFEPPIIKVQCKQILNTIDRPEVQQLHGAIERGEHGLFVTLGTFSAGARTFERTKPNLRLIDGETLIELIYAHYHQFEPRYQMLLPLKQSYIPGPVLAGKE